MATLAVTNKPSVSGALTWTLTTGTDTITSEAKTGTMFIRNDSASPATIVIDGAGAGTSFVPGLGNVNKSAGYSIAVAAGATQVVVLPSINQFLAGTVAVTGGGADVFVAILV